MTERDLGDLGIFRVPVPVPFPQAGGPANVYAVEEAGGGVLLFDSGLGTREAEVALEEGLRRAGRRFADVRRIVISHGHVDHYGAARTVLERSGGEVPVYAHPADIPKIADEGPRWEDELPRYRAYFEKLGVRPEAFAATAAEIGRGLSLARRLARVRPFEVAELKLRHVTLEPLHMPGHTSGLVCLYDREHRLFFSADHLLERVSPNPLIELGPGGEESRFRPLIAYLESVERLRRLEVDLVLPGHAEPFSNHRRVVDSLLEILERRQAKILALLAKGPLTAYEVAQGLFPRVEPGELFLTVSEAVANLEVLEARGEAVREVERGVYRFRRAG